MIVSEKRKWPAGSKGKSKGKLVRQGGKNKYLYNGVYYSSESEESDGLDELELKCSLCDGRTLKHMSRKKKIDLARIIVYENKVEGEEVDDDDDDEESESSGDGKAEGEGEGRGSANNKVLSPEEEI